MEGKRLAHLAVKDLNSDGYPEVYVFYLRRKAAPAGDGFGAIAYKLSQNYFGYILSIAG